MKNLGYFNQKHLGLLFVAMVLVGWFYWFQWRPSKIRETCAKWAGESAAEAYGSLGGSNYDYKVKFADGRLKILYDLCLNKRGIKN